MHVYFQWFRNDWIVIYIYIYIFSAIWKCLANSNVLCVYFSNMGRQTIPSHILYCWESSRTTTRSPGVMRGIEVTLWWSLWPFFFFVMFRFIIIIIIINILVIAGRNNCSSKEDNSIFWVWGRVCYGQAERCHWCHLSCNLTLWLLLFINFLFYSKFYPTEINVNFFLASYMTQ